MMRNIQSFAVYFLITAIIVLVALIPAYKQYKQEASDQQMIRDKAARPWTKVAVHRRSIPNGFILMFDKPISAEYEDNKITVLGVGRATLPYLIEKDPGPSRILPYPEAKTFEKMIILLKVAVNNCCIGDINNKDGWDFCKAGTLWYSQIGYGAESLDIPELGFCSFMKGNTGVRIQAIADDLPPKYVRAINDWNLDDTPVGFTVEPELFAAHLGSKSCIASATPSELQTKTVKISVFRSDASDGVFAESIKLPTIPIPAEFWK